MSDAKNGWGWLSLDLCVPFTMWPHWINHLPLSFTIASRWLIAPVSLIVNLTQSRIAWEESLHERVPGSGWPLGMFREIGCFPWIDVGGPYSLRMAPFGVLNWRERRKLPEHAPINPLLCTLDYGCHVTSLLMLSLLWHAHHDGL